MKIRQMEAEFFHENRRTDGRTDITKLTDALEWRSGSNLTMRFIEHLL